MQAHARRTELKEGINTLKMVARVRDLNPGETVELTNVLSDDVVVPANIVPRLVGRGGEARKALEAELKVLVDIPERKREEDAAPGTCALARTHTNTHEQ